MSIRGIRGATTVETDNEDEILSAARSLLLGMLKANPDLKTSDIASVIFTVTEDILTTYPARAARELGWNDVPLLCAQEISVPGGLPRCIRILIHWNTHLSQKAIHHIYQKRAVSLRPDLVKNREIIS